MSIAPVIAKHDAQMATRPDGSFLLTSNQTLATPVNDTGVWLHRWARFREIGNPNAGLVFDGRISEDFKLMTGTWVQTGKLRAQAMTALGDIAQDIVITGHGRNQIGLLIFPARDRFAALGIATDSDGTTLFGATLLAYLQPRLVALATAATGSATRITRALVLAEPPSLQHHEMTAKGNLNIRQVLTRRAALVDRLYDDSDFNVIHAKGQSHG